MNCSIQNYKGIYCRLIEPTTQQGKEDMFLRGDNRFKSSKSNFSKIPGSPVAYWANNKVIASFKNKLFYDYTISDGQNKTGNNAKFVRFFWEVSGHKVGKDKKWLFYAKGGGYRKWYGNLIDVVNWSPEARAFYKKDHICIRKIIFVESFLNIYGMQRGLRGDLSLQPYQALEYFLKKQHLM